MLWFGRWFTGYKHTELCLRIVSRYQGRVTAPLAFCSSRRQWSTAAELRLMLGRAMSICCALTAAVASKNCIYAPYVSPSFSVYLPLLSLIALSSCPFCTFFLLSCCLLHLQNLQAQVALSSTASIERRQTLAVSLIRVPARVRRDASYLYVVVGCRFESLV